MKPILLYLCLLLPWLSLAQPTNDHCDNPIQIINIESVACGNYTNVGATESQVSSDPLVQTPACWSSSQRDVWFIFQTSPSLLDVNIKIEGIGSTPIKQPQISVYEGFCLFDEMIPIACKAAPASGNINELILNNLSPNSFLFIRINDLAGEGDFKLCVQPLEPIVTINNGISTACKGILYDSGGETMPYSESEDFTFTVKPNQTNACLKIYVDNYELENVYDLLHIYDGENTSGDLLATLNLTGANLELQAKSGAVTFHFESDEVIQYGGFKIRWECTAQPCQDYFPITVQDTSSLQTLIKQFATPQVKIDSATIKCPNGAYATFLAINPTNIGIDKGVLLATGLAQTAVGPNQDDGFNLSTDFFAMGDLQLDTLANDTIKTQDACSLEMLVYAATSELSFNYLFASEEYPEYAPPYYTDYNDIFGFFISGPGFASPKNIALLPTNSNLPVNINNVNSITNPSFYRDNTAGKSIEYDGFTTVLQARADVIPCNWYRLKLSIADRGDGIFDSGVFLADLRAGTPTFVPKFTIANGNNTIVENCTSDSLSIVLSSPAIKRYSFPVLYEAMPAIEGVDVSNIPDTIHFEVGQSSFTFPLTVATDNLVEGTEQFKLTIFQDEGCGRVVLDSIIVHIKDKVVVEATQDTFFVCKGVTSVQLDATGAETYTWSPAALLNNANISNPIATLSNNQMFIVSGNVGICHDKDTTFVHFIEPSLHISPSSPTLAYCLNNQTTPIQLQAVNNANGSGITWRSIPTDFQSNQETIQVLPEQDVRYIATLNTAGCMVSDTISIKVDKLPNLDLIVNVPDLGIEGTNVDSIVLCSPNYVFLTSPEYSSYPNLSHQWLADGQPFSPPNSDLNVVINPTKTTTYTRSSTNGICTISKTIKVVVNDKKLVVEPKHSRICPNSEVQLTVRGGSAYVWQPNDGTLSSTTIANPIASPDETTSYIVSSMVNNCIIHDTAIVEVLDEAFTLSITPINPSIDLGSVVQLNVVADFGNQSPVPLTYLWSPAEGLSSPSLQNPTANPTKTTTYTVTATTANGCTSTTTVTITVKPPKNVDVPNSFMPNGDNRNDNFGAVIYGNTVIEQFQVFNRWGQIVFNNEGNRWNGTFKGKDLPPDVYIYVMRVRYADGRVENLRGDVTLIR